MIETIHLWKFAGGLGLFLLAMTFVEDSLIALSGRKLKIVFRKYTQTPLRGVLSGTIATAIVQSSSVVTLMVLSFVGAGIIKMRSALGVVIGSNLGTTFTGWVVATLGFKVDIQSFAFPLIAVGALAYSLSPKSQKLASFFRFISALGILFLGLDFMKESMSLVAQNFDIRQLQGYGIPIYFFFGFVFTAIIQSSSATMMITLAALNADLINLPGAAALVIGADLGTTTTALIGGIGGSTEKKQTSVAHFLFNIVTDVTALILIYPLLNFVTYVFGEREPLYSLVFFHSSFNAIGVLLFLPFTGVFADFLERSIGTKKTTLLKYTSKVNPEVPEAAIEALDREMIELLSDIKECNLQAFTLRSSGENFGSVYEKLKEKMGEVLEYSLRVQEQPVSEKVSKRLNQHIKALEQISRSAKSAKDIHHNMKSFESSANQEIVSFQMSFQQEIQKLYEEVNEITCFTSQSHIFEEISHLSNKNDEFYETQQRKIYDKSRNDVLDERVITTLINMNREIHSSAKSLLLALKDILLAVEKAEEI